jgi:hypothetical protein
MEKSYNGWTASRNPRDFGGIAPLIVAGEAFAPGVRSGDVWTVLHYVAEQVNARVEPLHKPGWHDADEWGFCYRQNRNAANLSCHASATAIDVNSERHPNGRRGTFSNVQAMNIHKILSEVEHVVRWGGDFTGTADEMHFEICDSAAAVKRVADRLRAGNKVQEEYVPLTPQDIDRIADAVWTKVRDNGFGDKVGPIQILNGVEIRGKDVQDKMNAEKK